MKISILGSCRQEPIESIYPTSSVKNKITYPHYTKEILSVIRFCMFGDVPPEETKYTFRTAIINNKPIHFTEELKNDFLSSDVYVIEIASRKSYKYKNRYTHHILYDDPNFNGQYKNDIICIEQSDSEIENDIIEMKNLLNKPIIIVGHIATYSRGSRFELVKLIEDICLRHNILFINPTEEVKRLGLNINNFVRQEKVIAHYNDNGKELMKYVYKKYITMASLDLSYFHIYNTEHTQHRIGSQGDGGYIICKDNVDYKTLLACGINNDINFEMDFVKLYPNAMCYAFDGTINDIPLKHDRIKFIKKKYSRKRNGEDHKFN